MDDLISRQAAIEAIIEKFPFIDPMSIIWTISDLPSAQQEDKCSECDAWNKYKNYSQPEIIHCKDCKRWCNDFPSNYCTMNDRHVEEWDFCSWAERREDG